MLFKSSTLLLLISFPVVDATTESHLNRHNYIILTLTDLYNPQLEIDIYFLLFLVNKVQPHYLQDIHPSHTALFLSLKNCFSMNIYDVSIYILIISFIIIMMMISVISSSYMWFNLILLPRYNTLIILMCQLVENQIYIGMFLYIHNSVLICFTSFTTNMILEFYRLFRKKNLYFVYYDYILSIILNVLLTLEN